jgi:hypothetical protein
MITGKRARLFGYAPSTAVLQLIVNNKALEALAMRHPKAILTALALSIGLGLLTVSARAAPIDACSLIAPADAESALDEPVGAPRSESRSSEVGDGSLCQYRSTAGGVGGVLKAKSVSVEVHYSQTDLTGSTGSITQNLKSAGFKTVHEVPGIGSAAVWASNSILGRAQAELTVIHGRSVMLIIILNGIPNETEALARARVIASKAIARL